MMLVLIVLTVVFRGRVNVDVRISTYVKTVLLILAKIVSRGSTLGSVSLGIMFLFNNSLALTGTLSAAKTKRLVTSGVMKLLKTSPDPVLLLLIVFVMAYILAGFVSGATAATLVVPVTMSLTGGLKTSPETIIVTAIVTNSYTCTAPVNVPTGAVMINLKKCGFGSCIGSNLPLVLMSFIVYVVLLPVLFPFCPWKRGLLDCYSLYSRRRF